MKSVCATASCPDHFLPATDPLTTPRFHRVARLQKSPHNYTGNKNLDWTLHVDRDRVSDVDVHGWSLKLNRHDPHLRQTTV